MNVHKVQSLSLDRAVVYLGSKNFVKGACFTPSLCQSVHMLFVHMLSFFIAQQCVAISRVRSLDGLAILKLDASKITNNNFVDPRAVAELRELNLKSNAV